MGQIVIDESMTDWIYGDKPNTFIVFMYLLRKSDENGVVQVSVERISKDVKLTPRQVRSAIECLKNDKRMTKEMSKDGISKGTIFTVLNKDAYFLNDKRNVKRTTKERQKETVQNTPQKRENYKQLFDRLIVNYNISNYVVDNGIRQWLKYKHERNGFHYKEIGMNTLLKKIEEKCRKYGDKAVVDIIEESISSSYQGIVFEKLERSDNNKKTVKQKQFDDFMQSILEDEQNGSY